MDLFWDYSGLLWLTVVRQNRKWLAAYATREGRLIWGIHYTWPLAPYMAPHPICLDSGWFRHQLCRGAAHTTSPQNPGLELLDNIWLGLEEISRNRHCMELWWTALQENLLHIHEWIHRQVSHEIWTLPTTQTTNLTAQTLWGDIWGQRTNKPWIRHESSTRHWG